MKPLDAPPAPFPSPVPSAADAEKAIAIAMLSKNEPSYSPFDVFGIPDPYRATDGRYMIYTKPDRSQYELTIQQHELAIAVASLTPNEDVHMQDATESGLAPTPTADDAAVLSHALGIPQHAIEVQRGAWLAYPRLRPTLIISIEISSIQPRAARTTILGTRVARRIPRSLRAAHPAMP